LAPKLWKNGLFVVGFGVVLTVEMVPVGSAIGPVNEAKACVDSAVSSIRLSGVKSTAGGVERCDPYADCVTRVNQFRACVCMGPLSRNTAAEACANQQAQHDSETGTAHSGFTDKICTPGGSAQNECPGYRSVAQTINTCVLSMFDEGPPPTSTCTGACYQTYGHFINMTNTRYKSVACGFYTTPSGQVWQVQNYFP